MGQLGLQVAAYYFIKSIENSWKKYVGSTTLIQFQGKFCGQQAATLSKKADVIRCRTP